MSIIIRTNKGVQEQINLSPSLSESETKIVVASKQAKVREGGKARLAHLITSVVDTSLIVLGHDKKKFSDEERFLVEREVVNDIFTNFSGLTYEEIRLACAMGARGEFKSKPDEVVYFSVSTVYNWLKCYIATSKREAMQKQARFEQDQYSKPEPSEEEKKAFSEFFLKEHILRPYKRYLEKDEYTFDNRGNVIYNKLDSMGVIPFSVERKKQIFERARNLVLAELEQWLGPDTRNKVAHIKEGKGEGHELVKSKAKELALRDFLKEMKDQQMDLEEFIEMRRND